jgi:hypothetical protein
VSRRLASKHWQPIKLGQLTVRNASIVGTSLSSVARTDHFFRIFTTSLS